MDYCVEGHTEGIIYNDAKNFKGDMDVTKGGNGHLRL